MKVVLSLFLCLVPALGMVLQQDTVLRFQQAAKKRTPIILVPGDGGSRVYARLTEKLTDQRSYRKSPWFRVWLNYKLLMMFQEHYIADYFKLNYNSTTRKTSDQPGVETAIFNWGGTESIELLDSYQYAYSQYFVNMVKKLVAEGYVRDVDVRGAPYDFRRAPNENVDFVPKMKALVEETYQKNGNQRVMLLAHSLGNQYTLFFLRNMTASWKKKYVRAYAAVSAPLGGAVKTLKLETSGDKLSSLILIKSYMREVERSMPTTAFLLPSPRYWKSDEVLVSRPSRNYTVKDYHQLFTDIKFPDGWEMYKDTSNLVDPTWIPDVDELYCFHGVSVPTPKTYVWKKDSEFPDKMPDNVMGDGDGTVNLRSLKVCHNWPNVKVKLFPGARHQAILSDEKLIATVMQTLQQPDKEGV